MTTKDFLIYNKHVCNLYRNRVVSLKNWTDITGTGNAFHLIAARGGNVIGDNAGVKCAFKYNVIEADRTPAAHCDIQGWKTTWEFNDFGGNQVNIYMHCGRSGRTASGKVYKTLLAGSYSRFVGNIGGVYVVGNSRADVGYGYYAPVLDCRWEGESGGAWVWEGTDGGVTASPNGTAIVWGIDGKNTETFNLTFPGDTAKVGCAPGQLTRAAGTVETAEMSLAYAGNGFTKAEKGLVSREGLVWDYVGDGGGGGGGPDGTYGLTRNNMTVHMPSDDMPTDYPEVSLTWLAGGGFDLKANNSQDKTPHACIYVWHKLAPPLGDVEFNFYATMVDNNPSPTTDGVFALFSPRARGLAAYGADPNGWAPASWRTHPNYDTPGSDSIYRARTTGYRHSFMNTADTVQNSMQFRLRTYNGVDDGGTQLVPTVPNPIPASGDSFLFAQGTRYLINVVRAGTVETGTKTDPAGGKQVWTFDDRGARRRRQGRGRVVRVPGGARPAREDRAGAGGAVLPELRWRRRRRRPGRPGEPVVEDPRRQPQRQALEPRAGPDLRHLGLDAQDGRLRRDHGRLAPQSVDDERGHRRPGVGEPRRLRQRVQDPERLPARLGPAPRWTAPPTPPSRARRG
jgi:hypothetical protein